MNTLAGKRIVVTRAQHQAGSLAKLLRQYDAVPILYPCLAIVPPQDTTQLDVHLNNLSAYDWLIVTSSNTVYALAERFKALRQQPDWSQTQVAAVGPKTATVFYEQFGKHPDFVPDTFTGESLAQTIPIHGTSQIFVPQSEIAEDTLVNILSQRGAAVVSIDAYRTIIGEGGDNVPDMIVRNEIDMVTFTSPSSVQYFMQRIHPLQPLTIPNVCIGPTTAAAAIEIGFTTCLVPNDYTLKGMLNTLQTHFQT